MTLAAAIARMEGWGVSGSRAQRNNNPGNLRASSLAVGKDAAGFAIFPDPETGWRALDRQIAIDAGRGLTLDQFVRKYAPPHENDTGAYLANVVAWTGRAATELLSAVGAAASPVPIYTSKPAAVSPPLMLAAGLALGSVLWLLVD